MTLQTVYINFMVSVLDERGDKEKIAALCYCCEIASDLFSGNQLQCCEVVYSVYYGKTFNIF